MATVRLMVISLHRLLATIILVCVLVAIFYHFGIMQRVVSLVARAMNWVMRVSGAEALSNVASAFVKLDSRNANAR